MVLTKMNRLTPAVRGRARELQRAFGIDRPIKIDGAFLVDMMHTGCQMNHGLRTSNGVRPVGGRTDRANADFIVGGR